MQKEELKPEKRVDKNRLTGNGRLRISRETERRFFFIMTVIMLVMGILVKTGIW